MPNDFISECPSLGRLCVRSNRNGATFDCFVLDIRDPAMPTHCVGMADNIVGKQG